jgi:tetratricopeptide (TPR) repeat protein
VTRQVRLLLTTTILCLLETSCRRTPPPETARDIDRTAAKASLDDPVRLEPFHVKAAADDEGGAPKVVDAYDAGELFERAGMAFRLEQFSKAVEIYQKIVEEFPDSSYVPLSLYNSGLARERIKDFGGAVADYRRLVQNHPASPDVKDALFRMAGALEALEEWRDVAEVYTNLLFERPELEGIERVECLAKRGAAYVRLGEPVLAEESLRQAIALFRTGTGLSPSASTYYYGMAQFEIGELLEMEMHGVELPADESLLETMLEKKCRLLLDAQTEYTGAIRVGHPHWAAAAAYRIGQLYRILWDDLLKAPLPPGLDTDEREIYTQILKKRIRVLLTKAVRQWERVLKMAGRLSLDNEWVEQTRRDLEEVRRLLVVEEGPGDVLPD